MILDWFRRRKQHNTEKTSAGLDRTRQRVFSQLTALFERSALDAAAKLAAVPARAFRMTKLALRREVLERWRRDGAFSCQMCVRAIDALFAAGGGSALYESNPLQRAFRDVHAAASHISMSFDVAGTTYGRALLGLDSDNPTL